MNGAANGANRIRFEKLSERLQRVNIDILHKVSTVGALQTTETVPDSGELGCFFQDELEQAKKLETSKPFRKYTHCYSLDYRYKLDVLTPFSTSPCCQISLGNRTTCSIFARVIASSGQSSLNLDEPDYQCSPAGPCNILPPCFCIGQRSQGRSAATLPQDRADTIGCG